MRTDFCKALTRFHAIKLENAILSGTPDVNGVFGWAELKYLKKWPVRHTTKVRIRHFVPLQRGFLKRRTLAGESCYFVLLVGSDDSGEWLILDGYEAACLVGKLTKQELINHSLLYLQGLQIDQLLNFFHLRLKNSGLSAA